MKLRHETPEPTCDAYKCITNTKLDSSSKVLNTSAYQRDGVDARNSGSENLLIRELSKS